MPGSKNTGVLDFRLSTACLLCLDALYQLPTILFFIFEFPLHMPRKPHMRSLRPPIPPMEVSLSSDGIDRPTAYMTPMVSSIGVMLLIPAIEVPRRSGHLTPHGIPVLTWIFHKSADGITNKSQNIHDREGCRVETLRRCSTESSTAADAACHWPLPPPPDIRLCSGCRAFS